MSVLSCKFLATTGRLIFDGGVVSQLRMRWLASTYTVSGNSAIVLLADSAVPSRLASLRNFICLLGYFLKTVHEQRGPQSYYELGELFL